MLLVCEQTDLTVQDSLVEETDILDIQKELDHVVDNLIRGSKFHLNSFVAVLRFYGVEYEPALLTKEVYLEILGE